MESSNYSYRYFGTFRFILAILVVISHFQQIWSPLNFSEIINPFGIGAIAVYLFFIVSGFVITEALFVFYRFRITAFLLNRFLRIYPPFVFALILSLGGHFIVSFLGIDVLNWGDGRLFLERWEWDHNMYSLFSPFNWELRIAKEKHYLFVRYVWAIIVEIQFYIIAACLFYLSTQRKGSNIFWHVFFISAFLITHVYHLYRLNYCNNRNMLFFIRRSSIIFENA